MSKASADTILKEAYDNANFIKLGPGILKYSYAAQINFLGLAAESPKRFVESVIYISRIKSTLLATGKTLSVLSNSVKDSKYNNGNICKNYILAFDSYLKSLISLCQLDEKYMRNDTRIMADDTDLPITDLSAFLESGELVDEVKDGYHKCSFNFSEDSPFYFLNKDVPIQEYRRYYANTYSPDFTYYEMNDKMEFTKLDINEDTFNPNVIYYVLIDSNTESIKSMLLNRIETSLRLLDENKELWDEYKTLDKDKLDPVTDDSNKFLLKPSEWWSTRKNSHRAKQLRRLELNDMSRGLNSNQFAEQWNTTRGNSYKINAAKFMSSAERLSKDAPKLISSAVQSVFEPMAAVVVTPMGPGAVATNTLQILGTVTKIVSACIALAALVTAASGYLNHLGFADIGGLESISIILAAFATITALVKTLESILSKLPQL